VLIKLLKSIKNNPKFNKHLRYLSYVLIHKWFVFVECYKAGIIWRGIVHDLSKFSPSEWTPYVENFYGEKRPKLMDTHGGHRQIALYMQDCGYKFAEDIQRDFNYAWLHHQKVNKHHHQYWVLLKDDGNKSALKMPEKYMKEMLADWKGAGKAISGKDDTKEWYQKNKENMILHPDTQAWIERQLGV
jgi:hypothetical protein